MKRIRVLVADDHAVLRAGLTRLLNAQPDIVVVGEASDGYEAVSRTGRLLPDVLLLDITMPGIGGIDVIRQVKARSLPAAILVLTMHEDEGYLREALKAGALGYIPKKAAETELVSAIRAVHRGEVFVYSSLAKYVMSEDVRDSASERTKATDSYDELSRREQEVLCLVARGYTNQQAADKLVLSVKTVETYKARVMHKLDLHSRSELVRYALHRGLLHYTDETGPVAGS